jgi:nitrite reductase/ring-hydroxylating ferredoxin subunit
MSAMTTPPDAQTDHTPDSASAIDGSRPSHDTSTAAAGVPLCASSELAEAGRAHVFDLLEHGRPARAFALRFDGQVVAYLNRCAHVPAELDWQPGEFLDDSRRYIVCSMHGAIYTPHDGLCVQGPCPGRQLDALTVRERDGQVYWYPCTHFEPAFAD